MFTCNLIHKLKKLNPKIYFKNDGVTLHGVQPGGIWLKKPRKGRKVLERGWSKRGREAAQGHIDIKLGHAPCPELPEYDRLTECGEYMVRGWRTVVLKCVDKKAFTLDQARQEFSASLGEQTWDNLTYDQKEARLKEELKKDSRWQLARH